MKRMNRNRNLMTAAAVVAIVLGAQLALAQGPGGPGSTGKGCGGKVGGDGPAAWCDGEGGGPGHGFGMFGPRMAERLDLTEQQQEAIAKIRQEGSKGNLELRKQMMRLRNEIQGEMLKDQPSEKTVLDLTAQMGKIRTELQSNRIKQQLAIGKLLTPEQRDQMLLMGQGGRQGRGGHDRHGRRDGSGCGAAGDCQGHGHGRGPGRQVD